MSTAQGERRLRLAASRSLLYSLPANTLFELPGRPHVVYQLRTYASTGNVEEAALQARNDSPFLFKAFETGQIGPKRLARIHGDKPRVATIHEYLDWTVTAQAAEGDDELDFGGFRVLLILPRYRSGWPPPGGDVPAADAPPPHLLGAPMSPMPPLQSHGRPVTAATIRSGPGYLEIPFVATHENKRGRGYCRCLVEAIEDIARALGLHKLMLCSTNDAAVQSTWQHLGFQYASDEQMEEWDILHTDLVYLQNTTQMHKDVPPRQRFKPVIIRHEVFRQRTYAFVGHKRPQRPAGGAHAPAKRPNKRRSVSSVREDSQLLAAREQAASVGGYANSSPNAASTLGATPRAASSGVGRPLFSEEQAQDLQQHLQLHQHQHFGGPGGLLHRDEGVASGGPPTPPPADGGPSRPLLAHANSAMLGATPASAQRSRLSSLGLPGQGGMDAVGHGFGLLPGGDLSGPGLGLAGAGGLGDGQPGLGLDGGLMPYQGAWLGSGPSGSLGLDNPALQLPVQPLLPHGGFGQTGVQAGLQPLVPMGGLYPMNLPPPGQPFGPYAGMPLDAQAPLPLDTLYPGPGGLGSAGLGPSGLGSSGLGSSGLGGTGLGPGLQPGLQGLHGGLGVGGRLPDGPTMQQPGGPYPGLVGMHSSLQLGLQPGAHVGFAAGGMRDGQRMAQLASQPLLGGLQQQGSGFGFNPSQPPPLLPDGAG